MHHNNYVVSELTFELFYDKHWNLKLYKATKSLIAPKKTNYRYASFKVAAPR